MSDKISWGVLVGDMLERRLQIARVAPQMFPPTLPGARATDAEIAAGEARLGFPLDPLHRAILAEGNGWPDAFAFGDILATTELGQGPLWTKAHIILDALYDEIGQSLPPRDQLYPIHVSDEDVFVIDRSGPLTDGGHPVVWLGDELIDQWPNAYEYWLAGLTMLARLRARLEDDVRNGRN